MCVSGCERLIVSLCKSTEKIGVRAMVRARLRVSIRALSVVTAAYWLLSADRQTGPIASIH